MAQNTYVETFGAALVYGTAGGSPATALAGITKIDALPAFKMNKFGIEGLDDASRALQFAPNRYDPGQFKFMLRMTKADFATLAGIAAAGTLKSWKVTLSNGSLIQSDGFIEELGLPTDEKGQVSVSITIQCSGATTFTA